MKFSLKAVAISALLASTVIAAPVDVEKRDATSDRISACFVGLIFTGAWPGSCQAAVAVNLGLIRSIDVNQMSMDFTPTDPWKPTTSSNSIVATMLSIPGITLPIDSVRQHIILTDSNNVQLGNIDTAWSAASVKGGTLTTSFTTSTLNVFPNAHTAFSNFIGALSTKATYPVTLQGAVDVKLNLGIFGHLTVPGIGFKATTPFAGLNNLNLKYIYLIDTNFDNPGAIVLTTIVNIVNPSKLSLKLGDVSFSTASEGGRVGTSVIKNLSLVPGNNYVLSATNLDMSLPAAGDFLSNVLPNKDGVLTLTGFEGTSSNVALKAGLAVMKSQLVVPQNFQGSVMSQAPYKDWALEVVSATAQEVRVQITATFQSPYYGFPIKMAQAVPDNQDNFVAVNNVSPTTNGLHFFNFDNNLTFSVSGTGSATVKFQATLIGPFDASTKAAWQDLTNFATKNGHLPITFTWMAGVVVNNDGITRLVDWGNGGTGLGDLKLKTGADFASILKVFA
ncbi:hypothetical protein BGX28_004182 [Mortierella sp. GBA30]|nr:hypothetical protein BGX28_004182 [Mortierella sp. GBA30]